MGLQSSEGGYSTAATDQHRARPRRAFCSCLGAAGDARHDHEAAADAAKRGHVSRDDDRQHVDNNFHTVRRKSGLSFSRRLSRRLLDAKKNGSPCASFSGALGFHGVSDKKRREILKAQRISMFIFLK